MQRYVLHQHIADIIIRLHGGAENADCLGVGDGRPPVTGWRNIQGGVEPFLSRPQLTVRWLSIYRLPIWSPAWINLLLFRDPCR